MASAPTTSSSSSAELEARLDRFEALEAIRQLAFGYAVAIDARDLEALVNLYVDDVRVGDAQGREALKAAFDAALRQFTCSAHHVSNHLIEMLGPEDAIGLVGCRIEHEVGEHWVTASLLYHDRYVRRGGTWLFRGRVQSRLYATAHGDPPIGAAKVRWPGAAPAVSGYHDALPSWREFWDGVPGPDWTGARVDRLVSRLRRTHRLPPPPRYIFAGPPED